MTKIHHVHDRSIEHAKSRDTMAHRLITPTQDLRSTRGHAVGDVVDGKTVRPLPAVDTQARHGGKAKGGVVAHSWGNTPQQIAQDGTRHLIDGAPDASSASPLDTLSTSQYGKRTAKPPIHSSMTKTPHTDCGDDVLAESVASGSTTLPGTVKES
jgi:hypothetical protein